MDNAFPVPREPVPKQAHIIPPSHPQPSGPFAGSYVEFSKVPFMKNMEEISYWISTKQAPCLYKYDNVIKRQCAEAHCSKPVSIQSITLESPSPKKKKKRKLSLLDDESVSTGKQHNVYFETSQNKTQHTILGTCKSDSMGSDLDFNIKKSSIQDKSKRSKLNKQRTTMHKKNKIVSSTPKVTAKLRRSLRKSQQNLNNNSQFESSFETNCNVTKIGNRFNNGMSDIDKTINRLKKELFAGGDQNIVKQNCIESVNKQTVKVGNGQFDDLSDLSGLTANYIRSTKVNSGKKLRNVRGQGNRSFIKESQQKIREDQDTMLVCVNKSVNTGMPTPVLNCSTDSSQNVLNLVTLKNDKSTRISRSTSLLKFMDTKNNKKVSNNLDEKDTCNNLSKTSVTSRYPKRGKNSSAEDVTPKNFENNPQSNKITPEKRKKTCKNSREFNNSDRKENPEKLLISRTRSGRCIGLALRQPENSVLVLSNSMEQESSFPSVNVAGIPNTGRPRRRRKPVNKLDSVKKQEQSEVRRDYLRDKSGFTACFSDSDEEMAPDKEKKFFC